MPGVSSSHDAGGSRGKYAPVLAKRGAVLAMETGLYYEVEPPPPQPKAEEDREEWGKGGGILVFGDADVGKSLWDVVRRSVKSDELWRKEAIWHEVSMDGDDSTLPMDNTAGCEMGGGSALAKEKAGGMQGDASAAKVKMTSSKVNGLQARAVGGGSGKGGAVRAKSGRSLAAAGGRKGGASRG